ncbi:MAG: electron transfer flavoprotein subunit alpha/FixB family protein [Desulfomonilia bacterium]
MSGRFFIIALHEGGRIQEETWELVSFARRCCAAGPVMMVLSDEGSIERLAGELAHRTGLDVVGLAGSHLREYSAEAYIRTLVPFFRDASEEEEVHIAAAHTSRGIDFVPQLSIGIDACCITAVEDVGEGSFIRSLHHGRFRAEVRADRAKVVVTVLPGAFAPEDIEPGKPGRIRIVPAGDISLSTRSRGTRAPVHANMGLTRAEVIVSAGRGLGGSENIRLLTMLSSLFPKSALGATRAVCDQGWLDYSHQIGSTGNTVSPRLYLACGISGAIQHLAGMRNSGMIVAINTDPHAAIFRTAHYGIVEDLTTFIPLLVDRCLKRG